MSGVKCHYIKFYFFETRDGASQGRVCYQRGLPRLVNNDMSEILRKYPMIEFKYVFYIGMFCDWHFVIWVLFHYGQNDGIFYAIEPQTNKKIRCKS